MIWLILLAGMREDEWEGKRERRVAGSFEAVLRSAAGWSWGWNGSRRQSRRARVLVGTR